MKFTRSTILFSAILILLTASPVLTKDKPRGIPPAKVIVSEVSKGMVAPTAEFIGTVFYEEVSDVASELDGLVEVVKFEEGHSAKKRPDIGQTPI